MMYELMVAANVKNSESLAGKIEKALKEASASGVKSEKLGEKTLAYPIAKQTEADYFLYSFDAEGEAVNKLTGVLRLEQDAVLRYLITKTKISKKVKKVKNESKESEVEERAPKVTVKTKIVAKKAEKVVKRRRGKKGIK